MRHGTARHQMTVEQTELPLEGRGEAPRAERRDELTVPRSGSPLGSVEAGGMLRRTKHCTSRCPARTSSRLVSRDLRANLNSPNRRMRTRMSGGVRGK
jgi:hypothetical protein